MNDKEPVYEYIKGQGWVANGCESVHVVFKNGRSATIYNREPKDGEDHTSIGKGSPAAHSHGNNFEGHCKWIAAANWYNTGIMAGSVHTYTVVFDK